MQLCKPGYDSTHIFGMMVTSNGSFSAIQDAIKSWSKATCLSSHQFLDFWATLSEALKIQQLKRLTALILGVSLTSLKLFAQRRKGV